MGTRGSWTIGRIGGIPIRIHFSWLFVAAYLTLVFTAQFRRLAVAAHVPGGALVLPSWVWGLLLTILMFVCVTIHELAHVAVARRGGAQVRAITLMMLGGVSEIGEVERPRLELVMALAGPLSSLVLAAIFYGLFFAAAGGPADLRFGIFYLAEINLVIGVFNLLPAFPMDGGRALRSALVGRLGRLKATRVAAQIGKGFAVALAIYGLFVGGWWVILIAAFVFIAGEAESRALQAREALRGLKVGDLFARRLAAVPPQASAEEAAVAMLRARLPACLIADERAAIGIVSAEDLSALPVRARGGTAATALMRPVVMVSVDDDAASALKLLDEQGLSALAVRQGDDVVGLLAREDIARGIELRTRLAEDSGR